MNDKDRAANEIVKRYALYAAGAGLIPVPLVDFAAITALELKLVQELAGLYEVEFKDDLVRPIVAALIGGYGSQSLGYGVGRSALKAIPFIGQTIGLLSVSAFGGGLTWAVGKVFIQHFASGGTFLNFDPEKVRSYFRSAPTPAPAAAASAEAAV